MEFKTLLMHVWQDFAYGVRCIFRFIIHTLAVIGLGVLWVALTSGTAKAQEVEAAPKMAVCMEASKVAAKAFLDARNNVQERRAISFKKAKQPLGKIMLEAQVFGYYMAEDQADAYSQGFANCARSEYWEEFRY